MSIRYNIYNNVSVDELMLVGNPQISYFSKVYYRHTYFDIKTVKNELNMSVSTRNSFVFSFPLNKVLISKVYFFCNYKHVVNTARIPDNIGTKFIDSVYYGDSDKVNSNTIEHLSGDYIDILNQLNTSANTYSEYRISSDKTNRIISNNLDTVFSGSGGVFNFNNASYSEKGIDTKLNIPFSFSRNYGISMPILSTSAKYITVKMKNINEEITVSDHSMYFDLINLRENELLRFKKSENEYIYKRVYKIQIPSNINVIEFAPKDNYHTIKSIIWTCNDISSKFQISIDDTPVTKSDEPFKECQYFSKICPFKAGLPGYSRTKNGSNVIYNESNNICYYTFGLTDDNKNNGFSPTGSVNTDNHIVKLRVDDRSNIEDKIDSLYIETYNVISYSVDRAPRFVNGQPKEFSD